MSRYVYVCIADCASSCNRHVYLLDTGELVVAGGSYIKESSIDRTKEKLLGMGILHGG